MRSASISISKQPKKHNTEDIYIGHWSNKKERSTPWYHISEQPKKHNPRAIYIRIWSGKNERSTYTLRRLTYQCPNMLGTL